MTMFVKRVLGLGLLGLAATTGVLQAGQQAKFHLPFAATWGAVTLAPGDYTVSLPEIGLAQHSFLLIGEGTQAYIPVMCLSEGVPPHNNGTHSYLTLKNVDGTYYVESYESGTSEREFSFMVPKSGVRVHYGKRETVKVDASGM